MRLNCDIAPREQTVDEVEAEPEYPVANRATPIDTQAASINDEEYAKGSKDAENRPRCTCGRTRRREEEVGNSTQNAGEQINENVSPFPIEDFDGTPYKVEGILKPM